MTTAPHSGPATWEQYEALGESRQAEYIDGQIVMSPLPSVPHQAACFRLAQLLMAVIPPTHLAIMGTGWKPNTNEFGPGRDGLCPQRRTIRYTGTPALAVEVLSSNRSHDLVLKFNKYAEADPAAHWIVDLRDRGQLQSSRRPTRSGRDPQAPVTVSGHASTST